MQNGKIYTLGIWRTIPGKEDEFIALWQSFADWTTGHVTGSGEGILLLQADNAQRLVSFGPWEDAESVVRWREKPEFKQFADRARELCDEFDPLNMQVVGHSGSD